FSSRRRHTRLQGDWSSDVCSSDLMAQTKAIAAGCKQACRFSFFYSDFTIVPGPRLPSFAPSQLLQIQMLTSAYTAGRDSASNVRSEERRVGKECRTRWSPNQ